MSLTYNNTNVKGITYNGNTVKQVTMDGVIVWTGEKTLNTSLNFNIKCMTYNLTESSGCDFKNKSIYIGPVSELKSITINGKCVLSGETSGSNDINVTKNDLKLEKNNITINLYPGVYITLNFYYSDNYFHINKVHYDCALGAYPRENGTNTYASNLKVEVTYTP